MSEAALGGVLHALKVPLTGLFIGSSAVIFISLIGYFSGSRKEIFKSMMIVLFVKAMVSPFTPPMAYLAVFIQGAIGSVLFFSKKFHRFSSILFGIVVLMLSSLQKIVFFTLIYGNNLWKTIDEFGKFITEKIPFIGMVSGISLWIIGIYIAVHLYAGLTAGLIAGALPGWLSKAEVYLDRSKLDENGTIPVCRKKPGRRKMWGTSLSGILIFILTFAVVILTYIFSHFSESVAINALIMLVRSFLVMGLWFFIISPYLIKLFRKFSGSRESRYSKEIESVMTQLPFHRTIVTYSWKLTKGKLFPVRIKEFIINTFAFVLLAEEKNNK